MKAYLRLIILIPIFSFAILSLIYNLDILSNQGNFIISNQTNTGIFSTPINNTKSSNTAIFNSTHATSRNIIGTSKSVISSYFDYILLSLILAFAIFSLFAIFYSSSGKPTFKFRAKKTYETNPILEFKEILKENIEIFKINYSKESNPILELYKRICSFLESKGIVNAPQLTAKEFEKNVYEILGRKIKGFDILTNLFEEARYSKHELNEEKIKYCESLIKDIIDELNRYG